MPAPFISVLYKTEKAAKSYAATQNVGTSNLYHGKNAADRLHPSVSFVAAEAVEHPRVRGNWFVALDVTVRYSARVTIEDSDPVPEEDDLTSKTFDCFVRSDLHTQLNAQSITDFHCIGIADLPREIRRDLEGDCWAETLRVTLLCTNTSLA